MQLPGRLWLFGPGPSMISGQGRRSLVMGTAENGLPTGCPIATSLPDDGVAGVLAGHWLAARADA